MLLNAAPAVGEERLSSWNPAHEALPAGCRAPEVLCNPRDFLANPWPRDTVAADARYPPPPLPYVNAGHGSRQLRCLMCQKNVCHEQQELHGEGDEATAQHNKCMWYFRNEPREPWFQNVLAEKETWHPTPVARAAGSAQQRAGGASC